VVTTMFDRLNLADGFLSEAAAMASEVEIRSEGIVLLNPSGSRGWSQGLVMKTTVIVSLLGCGFFGTVFEPVPRPIHANNSQQDRKVQSYRPPIVDVTSVVILPNKNGEQHVQSIAVVDHGAPSKMKVPGCLGSGEADSGSTCINLCVRMPAGSKVSRIETFAHEVTSATWLPCGSKICLNSTPSTAHAMFDTAGPTESRTPAELRTCWVFKNWDSSKAREVIMRVSFKAPADVPSQTISCLPALAKGDKKSEKSLTSVTPSGLSDGDQAAAHDQAVTGQVKAVR
jgi:hypothetical protein